MCVCVCVRVCILDVLHVRCSAHNNCPDILKVDWEVLSGTGHFVLTLDSVVRILSDEELLLRALC